MTGTLGALSGPFGTYGRFELGDRLEFRAIVSGGSLVRGLFLRLVLVNAHPRLGFGGFRRRARSEVQPPGPRLLARLEPALRGAVIRVAAHNHYLDIVTENGRTGLLMRLSDALAELDGADGMQVQRARWGAAPAVAGASRKGDRVTMVLKDCARVPVRCSYHEAVEKCGLIGEVRN